jgi:hypothetical protein
MRERLRRLAERLFGTPGRAFFARRTRDRAEALLEQRGWRDLSARIAAPLGELVQRGPFEGLRYPRRRGDIVHLAKLLGAYECELHPALDQLVSRAPTLVVNVGSGDGYYAVGLARLLPEADVIAVDPDPIAQRACRETAELNDVAARVRFTEELDAAGLQRVLGSARALCVVDCEGYEDDLLDPALAPALARTDILVETHDFARAGVNARLTARFSGTHRVERIAIAARVASAFPELAGEPPATARGLLDEFRHVPQSWLVFTARTRPS